MFSSVHELKKMYRYDVKRKTFHIDIRLDYYRDLYNEWDYSPLHRRDIDMDLLEFIEECTSEIPLKFRIQINFYLPKKVKNSEIEEKNITGMKNFFSYTLNKQLRERRRMFHSSLVYGLTGSALLIGAFLLQTLLKNDSAAVLISEGLFIGGWVLFWELFSFVFFRIQNVNREIRNDRRILEAQIVYHYI